MNTKPIDLKSQFLDTRLTRTFYGEDEVTDVAQNLLGKHLCTFLEGQLTVSRITETEAYCGRNDRACHAHNGHRTVRTNVMYGPPGYTYVYLCYGIHHLFNVVTNREGLADAVLIRSVEPLIGIDNILNRREAKLLKPGLVNGPGKLTEAMGIRVDHNQIDLTGDCIWISDAKRLPKRKIAVSPRIGVDYAGEDAQKPWRFTIRDSSWLSR